MPKDRRSGQGGSDTEGTRIKSTPPPIPSLDPASPPPTPAGISHHSPTRPPYQSNLTKHSQDVSIKRECHLPRAAGPFTPPQTPRNQLVNAVKPEKDAAWTKLVR